MGQKIAKGYAVVWDAMSGDLGGYRETFRAGSFGDYLRTAKPDLLALVDHDPGKVLGRVSAGTLRVWEDQTGLAFECLLPDTTLGRDTAESVNRRDIKGMSFRFAQGAKDKWSAMPDGTSLREVLAAKLREVTITAVPAYDSSNVIIVSADAPKRDAAEWRLKAVTAPTRHLAERRLKLLELT